MSLNIYNPKIELLSDFTGIFKIQNCPYCRMYDEFIESVNMKLPMDKQIEVIDCTSYHDYGIVTDKRIPIFLKYYGGSYPSLFINGLLVPGANSVEELKAFVNSYFSEDFLVDVETFTFDKQCDYVKKGIFRKKINCEG